MKKTIMIMSAILAMGVITPMTTHAVQQNMGTLKYDLNFDSRIDGIDASMVLTEYANVSVGNERTFTSTQHWLADTNYDGLVTAVDASNILTRYAYNSSHDKPMPTETVIFAAHYKPKDKGTYPMNYQAFFIEDVYHYINCSKDSYPDGTEFAVSINETIWGQPIKCSDMIVSINEIPQSND